MPSASTKSDIKPPVDPTEGVKQILNIVDKKIRNLEKRKGKLDLIREKKDSGKELNADQVEAISRYDQVLQNLDLSREFQKQFMDTLAGTEKLWKKQQKREKIERQQEDLRRVQEVLTVQNVLDSMGADSAREDFSSGQHGAVQLSEDNLNQLDELYKLISPTRENEEVSFRTQVVTCSEHFSSLLEGKEKEVNGTTYKDLRQVVDKIVDSGYLDRPANDEGKEETAAEESPEVALAPAAEELEQTTDVIENGQMEEDVPGTDDFGTNEEPEVIEPEPTEIPAPTLHSEVLTQETQPEDQQLEPTLGGGNTESEVVDDAFFSTAFHNKQRPFNEIVSSVQGNFNFLQDSEIDLEKSRSPHMDPAVVAAHPMPQSLPIHQTDSSLTPGITSQTYQSSTFVTGEEQVDSPQQQSSQQSSLVTAQTGAPSLVNQSEIDNTYSQNYTGHMSHSLQDSSLPSMVNKSSDLSSHVSQSAASIGQTTQLPSTDTTVLPPQPIPMPNQTTQEQLSNEDLQTSQEKKFSMNANAAVFRSIYSPSTSTYQPGTNTTADGSNHQEEKDDNTQRGQQNDYQSGYNSYGRMNNNNNRGGRGGRGGSGGQRGGMSNGYNNSRGGNNNNSRGGAPFNNRNNMSGGTGSFSSGGGRGGNNRVPFNNQGSGGYQPRTDSYRQEGYQGGYNNSSYGSGGYKNRGGNSRGNVRGNSMRGSGGPPRGGNNMWRGGRGGNNNGKPNLGYQSQGQGQATSNVA